jgi:hypothetical protein
MKKIVILLMLIASLDLFAVAKKEAKSEKLRDEIEKSEKVCDDLSFNGDEDIQNNPELHAAISRCLGPELEEGPDLAFKE